MTLSDLSVERPILTWMMTLALIVFGVLGYNRLGMDQFPTMEFPVLAVVSNLDGATPEGMEEDVTDVLEEQLGTIAGVRKISSSSGPGTSMITVEFALGTDLDIVAQEVRDKIDQARPMLPSNLERPTVGKFDFNDQPILWIPFRSALAPVDASEYLRREVKPIFETIPGVAGIAMFGRQDRTIRIWIDGDALRARGLSAGDVVSALRREHVEASGGRVESDRIEYGVKTDAEFQTLAALERLVVTHQGGAPVYLEDVARLEDGSQDIRTVHRYNGRTTVGIGVRKQSGGNAVAIVDEVYERIDDIAEILPDGLGIDADVKFIDFSEAIREAVAETQFTLVFGALLAVFTVFVFLRRTRPTLIVATAIPISLIAAFGLVWLLDYTLNTMTLLGMTLAVGVVVDDAIVVLENIERHREMGLEAREAAKVGTHEITFAATAATLSVAAVFLPVVFVEGIVGSFLGSFGVTVAGSVLISLFVALTLTPMLAARMPPPKPHSEGSLYHRLEQGLEWLETSYRRALDWTLTHRARTIGTALAAFALALFFGMRLGAEFFPSADEGLFFVQIEAPPGSTVEATLEYLARDEAWFLAQPEVAGIFSAVGDGGGPEGMGRPNEAMMFGMLVPASQRERTVQEILAEGREVLGVIPGREVRMFNPAEMMRGGSQAGAFEVELRGNLPLEELSELTDRLIERFEESGGFIDLSRSLKLGLPELRVIPDREKAAALGVDSRSLAEALQLMIGGMDVGVFKEAGRRYDIRMRLEAEDRAQPSAIDRLYVRANDGTAVEIGNLVRTEMGAAPSAITRTNRQRSVTISANLTGGLTLGNAIARAQELAADILPPNVRLALAGNAEDMQESAKQFGIAIGLGILVIYMILAAQFESLVHPLTVMLALPLAMVGALGGLYGLGLLGKQGMTLNLFSMIGIVLLFGLVTKNSILLVDYANQLRARGLDKVEAMRQAAPVRMRPVLMTALSMIFGVLPAALGLGPGAESRAPMAVATAAGMTSSTVLTLLVVPVFYVVFDDAAEWVTRQLRRGPARNPANVPS